MQKTRRLLPRTLMMAAAVWLISTGSASADNESVVEKPPRTITSEILKQASEPGTHQSWLQSEFHTRKGRGFEYNRSLAVSSEKKLIFAIQGPLIKKRTPGLVFEIRF